MIIPDKIGLSWFLPSIVWKYVESVLFLPLKVKMKFTLIYCNLENSKTDFPLDLMFLKLISI